MASPLFEEVAESLARQLRYRLVRYVACGTFKETYEAEAPAGGRVALKIIDPAKCNLCRNEREIASMNRCDHSGIARLICSGEIPLGPNRFLYCVEEFFDGGSLGDRLTDGPLDPDRANEYGYHLARAISHLADLSLVHRDIKPENIMFRSERDVPILVDFGLVRDLSQTSITQSWQHCGPCTPFFASPEQLNNDKAMIDWRTDQFGLGMVVAYCLVLQHPFASTIDSSPRAAGIDAVANRRECSAWFRQFAEEKRLGFLTKMMHPWPNRRYVEPSEMVDAFADRR